MFIFNVFPCKEVKQREKETEGETETHTDPRIRGVLAPYSVNKKKTSMFGNSKYA